MGLSIRNIDHVVLRVTDIDRALRFYRDVLGCREEHRNDEIGLIQLRAGEQLIDLVPVDSQLGRRGGKAPAAEGHNMDHLCLRLEAFDETAIRTWLAEHGVTAGPTESRNGAEGLGPSIYLDDPDGNTIELKGPPQPSSTGTNNRP